MVAVNVSTSDEDKTIGQTTSEIVSGNVPTNSSGGRFVQNKKGSSAGGGPFSRGKLTLSGAKRLAIARTPIVGMRKRRGIKESVENRRERKAWRTLVAFFVHFCHLLA
jgi:hypothetical protein